MNFNPFENMFKANQEMMEAWKSFIPNPDKGSDAKKENSYSEDFLNYQKAFLKIGMKWLISGGILKEVRRVFLME